MIERLFRWSTAINEMAAIGDSSFKAKTSSLPKSTKHSSRSFAESIRDTFVLKLSQIGSIESYMIPSSDDKRLRNRKTGYIRKI